MSAPALLARCLDDPGYTPSREEIPRLLACLAALDPKSARRLARTLSINPALTADAVVTRLPHAEQSERRALYALLGRLATSHDDPRFFELLARGLADGDARARRAAASALGKLGDTRAEPLLLRALRRDDVALQRSAVEALGKVGGHATLRAFEQLPLADAELARRLEESRLLITRRLGRELPASIELARPLPLPMRVAFSCRRGLGPLLCRELAAFRPLQRTETRVDVECAASIEELLVARTAQSFALVLQLADSDASPEERIARALTQAQSLAALAAWSAGPPRFRLEWSDGAHHRALTWKTAERVRALSSALSNDSRAASWVALAPPTGFGELLLSPRLSPDPRFAYRRRDVPAASHPTIAAALAASAPLGADDVIWDPFVGSGLELIERARLGPYRRLLGSDLDPRALAAARENLQSAGVDAAELLEGDALTLAPEGVTLILSNPPFGRRVARDGSIKALLAGFVAHAGRCLPRGGRLVWLSPLERHTALAGHAAGFDVASGPSIDMGGFDARLQIMIKR